jgi:hypothetical protein
MRHGPAALNLANRTQGRAQTDVQVVFGYCCLAVLCLTAVGY